MPLINIIITLVIVGVALWAINNYIPMAKPVKTILNVVVVAVLVVWLLQVFGLLSTLQGITVGK